MPYSFFQTLQSRAPAHDQHRHFCVVKHRLSRLVSTSVNSAPIKTGHAIIDHMHLLVFAQNVVHVIWTLVNPAPSVARLGCECVQRLSCGCWSSYSQTTLGRFYSSDNAHFNLLRFLVCM